MIVVSIKKTANMSEKEFFQENKDEITEIIADAIMAANRESEDDLYSVSVPDIADGMYNIVLNVAASEVVIPLVKGAFRNVFSKKYQEIKNEANKLGLSLSDLVIDKIIEGIESLIFFGKKRT